MMLFASGCATPYIIDRGRDVADIFTATIGAGIGIKARIGPVQTGLIAQSDTYGLRGGTIPDQCRNGDYDMFPPTFDMNLLYYGFESYQPEGSIAGQRNKDFFAGMWFPFVYKPASPSNNYSYYSQVEVVVALGPSIRLGFNPGELLDFFLGIGAVDIYDDDSESKKMKEESNHH